MPETPNDILLVSYVFPPYPGIGGRRWAKFARYLSRRGKHVHVIAAENPFGENSAWTDDVKQEKNISVHFLPPAYPRVVADAPRNFFEKITYRFWINYLSRKTKGTIYDRAVFWEKKLCDELDRLHAAKPSAPLIATGAPFSVLYYSARWKEKNPEVPFIADLRDPWTWGKHAYGFGHLSASRMEEEKRREAYVIEKADAVLVPAEVMRDHLQKNYPQHAAKILVLPHGFDPDEIIPQTNTHSSGAQKKIIFFGSLYQGIENDFKKIAQVIGRQKDSVKLDIFSDSRRYGNIFDDAGCAGSVSYKPQIPSRELFRQLPSYDFVLVVYPDYAKDAITTKLYEIIAARVPVIYMGAEGKTGHFIEAGGTGIWIRHDDAPEKLADLISGKTGFSFNRNYDVSEKSFVNLTDDLLEIISRYTGSSIFDR